MNKKFLLSMFAAASMLFTTSCSEEEILSNGNGNEATVSFTVGVENGVQSRAISDGSGADKLVYAVFDKNGSPLLDITGGEPKVLNNVTFPKTVTITLAKGQNYSVVFWAQDADCTAYTVDDEMNVTIDYTQAVNNDEARDAFFASHPIRIESNTQNKVSEPVTLKRPFAQLNVGATKDDWDAAVASGIEVKQSTARISEVASKMNLLNGTVSTPVEVTYSLANLPAEDLMVDLAGDGTKEAYKYLSMGYFLVNDATTGSAKVLIPEVEFNFVPENGETINFSTGLKNIPAQRNYRTNIVGKILTSDVDFTVTIDPAFADEDINIDGTITAATTAAELAKLLQKGGTVRLTQAYDKIDFSTLTIEKDLHLILGAKLNTLKLGGNNTAAGANDVNVTVEVVKDVEYPTITFAANTKNVTLKGDKSSNKGLVNHIKVSTGENITFDGITSAGAYGIEVQNKVTNLTIQNCVATGMSVQFIDVNASENVKILNNEITYVHGRGATGPDVNHGIEVLDTKELHMEGNTITDAKKHGIMMNRVEVATITKNTITNPGEDGIKTDNSQNLTITDNEISATMNGIRIDRCVDNTIFTITGNTISSQCKADDGKNTYAININPKGEKTVDGTIIVKDNIIKSVANNQYFNIGEMFKVNEGSDCETPFFIADGVAYATDGAYAITNANGLKWVAENIDAKTGTGLLKGKTVRLMNDINLGGEAWTPMNLWTPDAATLAIFDGNNKKIIGMNVKGGEKIGFIGSYASSSVLTIQNLTFENPVVETSIKFAGTVVGYTYGNIAMTNVKVTGANIKTTATMGIRLGGLVGLYPNDAIQPLTLTECVVENSTITGYHNLSGLVGSVMANQDDKTVKFTKCLVKNNTFNYGSSNLKSWNIFDSNGHSEGLAVKTECTSEGNKGISSVGVIDYKDDKVVELSSKEQMFSFANEVNINKNSLAGYTVKLTANIDLNNESWTPIGQTGAKQFLGIFDGQNYTISNLYIDSSQETGKSYSSGLFGWIERHGTENLLAVKNVNVSGAVVNGHHNVAVIAGYLIGTIENCHVENATLTCTHANDDACGDKCGVISGIIAEATGLIKDCSAVRSTIKAGRDAGQIVGSCIQGKIENCSATDVKVEATGDCTGANVREDLIGRTN